VSDYTWILILVLPAAFWYLGARAEVTRFLWTRYPPSIAKFMDCAACSGAWYGASLGLSGYFLGFSLPFIQPTDPLTPAVTGLVTMLTTPMIAALHIKALEFLGTAVDDG